jgi:hypothetical protein
MSQDPTPEAPSDGPTADDGAADPTAAASEAAEDTDEEWIPLEGLSQEGLLLVFAGLACGLASLSAHGGGQPQPVVVFGAGAAATALFGFVADLLTEYVPDLWVHLVVGGGASVAGAVALAGQHWGNAATFGAAAALVLYRVVDVEYRGTS